MEHLAANICTTDISDFQQSLQSLGYELPKYGPDGWLGSETYQAIQEFCEDHSSAYQDFILPGGAVRGDFASDVKRIARGECDLHARPFISDMRPSALAKNIKGRRPWKQVTTIVLHQTGVWMNDTPSRFSRLKAHMGILRDHQSPVVIVGEPTDYMYHANSLNRESYGIEVNGRFRGHAGLEGDDPPEHQCINAIRGIEWVCDLIELHGGKVRNLYPHRMSSVMRRRDPGEACWKNIAVPAMERLGLVCGNPSLKFGDGRPIPKQWGGEAAY